MKKILFIILISFSVNQVYSYSLDAYKALENGEKNFEGKDLSNLDFSKKDFMGLDFKKMNFKKANLSGVKIVGVDISGSNFDQADLQNAIIANVWALRSSFLSANFKGAKLKNVDFNKSKFGCFKNLENSTLFYKVQLIDVDFNNCIFYSKIIKKSKNIGGACFNKSLLDAVFFDGSIVEKLSIKDSFIFNSGFRNLKLRGKYGDPFSFVLKNSRLFNCFFTDSTFKNKYHFYNTEKSIFLRTKGLSKQYRRMLKEKGGHVPAYSVMCNSDVNENSDGVYRPEKRRQINKMLDYAEDYSNNVSAVIWSGGVCYQGEKENWDAFINKYHKPLNKYVKKQFFCIGDHDYWKKENNIKERLNILFKNFSDKSSYAVDKIKSYNNKTSKKIKWKKGYYDYNLNNTDFICLDECPTMPEKEPVKWFTQKFDKNKNPKILFYHFNPIEKNSIKYWTTQKSSRPVNKKRGKRAIEYFYKKIKNYKDKIILQVTGHDHINKYKMWRDIPTICVGGDRFALVHIDPRRPVKVNKKWIYEPEVVAIEFIHPSQKTQVYYPCLEKIRNKKEKISFILKNFKKITGKKINKKELDFYLSNWDGFSGNWEVLQDFKNNDHYIKNKINKLYLKYIGKRASSSAIKHYLRMWKKRGKIRVKNHLKNSKVARLRFLDKWYKNYLDRAPKLKEKKFYIINWNKFGNLRNVKNRIKNTQEARPVLLDKWYSKYLQKKVEDKNKKFWLDNWENLRADKIEDAIKTFYQPKFYREIFI
ncbi:hypothetical protein GF385_02355 [Candidatus Dependentiae bacterium]|nr:hypothetical protein [Candidatus Dependentiae bacterium]